MSMAETTTAGRRGADPSYNPRRTLPLRVEFTRQLRRRRTWIAFVVLLLLPWILATAFKVGGSPSGANPNTPGLVVVATTGAYNFTAFTMFVSVGFLLVVAVALFCGDTVASEAGWASLRYLLAAPVPRVRLLRQKLIVAMSLSTLAVVALPVMAMLSSCLMLPKARLAFSASPLRSTAEACPSSETSAALLVMAIVEKFPAMLACSAAWSIDTELSG